MSHKLFVGGLPWSVSDDDLSEAFSQFGEVVSAKVITDRDSGKSRGFGFVEYNTAEEASAAIDGLNEKDLKGRTIFVSQAKDKK